MGKQVTATKPMETAKTIYSDHAYISLAEFCANPTKEMFPLLTEADQATAKLVLQSIESAKNEGKKEVEKAMADEKAQAEKAQAEKAQAELKQIESDRFWLPKTGLFFRTMHDFCLTGIDTAINQSGINPLCPEFPISDKKGDVRSINRRVVAVQFDGYWVEGHITVNPGTKPEDKKRGPKGKTTE